MRDDHLKLGLGEEAVALSKQVYLLEEFIAREHDRKRFTLEFKPLLRGKTLVHGHCHQKAVGAMKSLRKVLRLIPEFEFEFIDASCCGMAGSFGLEAEHAGISMQMAEIDLLPALRASSADTTILANGFSCRHQIREGVGRRTCPCCLVVARRNKYKGSNMLTGAMLGLMEQIALDILTLTEELNETEFFASRLTRAETLRLLRSFTKTAANLPSAVRDRMPEIDWLAWAALANALSRPSQHLLQIWVAVKELTPMTLHQLNGYKKDSRSCFHWCLHRYVCSVRYCRRGCYFADSCWTLQPGVLTVT